MAERCPLHWPTLALLVALLAAPATVSAADILRVATPTDAASPISLSANDVFTWTDGGEQIYVLGGSVLIQHGSTNVWASRAVVWVDAAAQKKKKPVQVSVFADEGDGKKVGVEVAGRPRRDVSAAVLELTTSAIGRVGGRVREQSLADTDLYRKALAARGSPAAAPAAVPRPVDIQPAQFLLPPATPPAVLDPPLPVPGPPIIGSTVIPLPLTETRTIWISPRSMRSFNVFPVTVGQERVFIITGGIKLLAKFTTGSIRSLDVEADQVVIWKKGSDAARTFDAMRSDEGSSGADGLELYLAGNVVIRYGGASDATPAGIQTATKTLRADRGYYDVANHRALFIRGDLEYTREGFLNAGHFVADELQQLASTEWRAVLAELHASRLPSDPGFKLTTGEASIYRLPHEQRRTIFGRPFRDRITGAELEEDPEVVEATDIRTLVRDVPIFYWPRVRADVNDPFGPLENLTFRQDRQFGTQLYTTFDVLELIGVTKLPNEKWHLLADYLSRRGPALGTDYTLQSKTMFGMDAPFQTEVKGYAIYDKGTDILAGNRQDDYRPTDLRGRFQVRHQQEFGDLTVQAQLAFLSDRNFYEQYYKNDFDQGPNQETFLWLKYVNGNAAATVLVQPDLGRDWVSETYWLPKVGGHLVGATLFDAFTYHTWGSAAYARLDPFRNPLREFPLSIDQGVPRPEFGVNTGRIDWMQQLALPLSAGPAKIVPYAVLDLAYYTADVRGDGLGRALGGLGVRSSIPFSRLYRDVDSDLLNLQGLYHKNVFSANYYFASSSSSYARLPELDRLNDDATEQAYRDITPWHPFFAQTAGPNGVALTTSPIFDPRLYAIRRLVDTKPDNLDSIHVLQLEWRQRLQTKRGYPGLEHTIDWLTFDLSASIFPTPDRDNFGNTIGFLEYNLNWNVGDRNGIFSNGWVDPFDFGAKFWSVGTYFLRDDRTSFYLTYRSADPIHSRIVGASASYVLSPKYAVTALTQFDFGSQASLTNGLQFTRIGTDVQVTFGFNYNALVNNFGFTFNVVPNLLASTTGPVGSRNTGNTQYQDRR